MLAHGISNLLNFFKRSLSAIHFQQGLEALESLHSSLPGPFRYGDEIGSPRRPVARGPIWVGDPHRDAFKFTLAHFPGNDGVQTVPQETASRFNLSYEQLSKRIAR